MFDRTIALILLFAIAGAAAGFWLGDGAWRAQAPPRAAVTIGAGLPSAAMPDLDGTLRQLSDWHGKPLLINFFATWCGPCIEEMPMLDRTAHAYAGQELAVLGIAEDDPDKVRAFVAQAGVTYGILLDVSAGELSASLGNAQHVLPFSVLVGRDGRVLDTHAGNFDQTTLVEFIRPALR